MRKKFKEITKKFIANNISNISEITNFLPEKRVMAFISALDAYSDEIENLADKIEITEALKHWKIPVLFRLIIIFLRAVFRLNKLELEKILINAENKVLIDYLACITEYPYISNEEWYNSKTIFEKYESIIIELAWKIKDTYHEYIWDLFTESYIENRKESAQYLPINVEECLEHINFTKYYPEQIITWANKYPDDLMLKTFFYMKLEMIPSVPLLNKRINTYYEYKNRLIRHVGINLGFYSSSPKLDKLYKFYQNIDRTVLKNIIVSNADKLIEAGNSNILYLIGDSTTCLARKDDPDAPYIENQRQTLTRTHKYQTLTDGNGIPLYIIRRPGQEHDANGWLELKDTLKNVVLQARSLGKEVPFILLDAGYFSEVIIKFIRDELKCTPIIDINPGNSVKLNKIKEHIEKIKQYWREIDKINSEDMPNIQRIETEVLNEFGRLKEILTAVSSDGTEFEKLVAKLILKVGSEEYLQIYRNRSVIEGLFGLIKSCYYLLGRPNRVLPIKGENEVEIHGLLTIIAMQFLALFNYKLLKEETNLLRSMYYIKLSELKLYY